MSSSSVPFSSSLSSSHLILKYSLDEGAYPPHRAHIDDAGLDLVVIHFQKKSSQLFLFDTGVHIEPPPGFYTELVPRSSLAWTDFILANSIGIIDPGYRGSLKIPLRYLGTDDPLKSAQDLIGKRVAQLLLKPLYTCILEGVPREQLSESPRGEGRFGSTGKQPTPSS